MSQFDAPSDEFSSEPSNLPPRTSGLAIASLVCSLIFFCPLTTLLGPILGLIALVTIKPERNQRGRGLAIAAIIIGVVLTAGWAIGGKRVFDFFYGYYAYMRDTPRETLESGFAGNYDDFRDAFKGPGAETSDEEVRFFIDTLRDRYGELRDVRFDQTGGAAPTPQQERFGAPYFIDFENKTVRANIMFTVEEPTDQLPQLRLFSITVYDEAYDDLQYPEAASEPDDDPWNRENADADVDDDPGDVNEDSGENNLTP